MITLLLLSVAPAWATVEVSASVYERAVKGQSVHVLIEVRNPTREPTTYPDLTNRPWLVQFETVDPTGTRRTVFSTPPEVDTEQTWTLAPDGRRRTRFEIPTSSDWSKGKATLSIIVKGEPVARAQVEIVDLVPHHSDPEGAPVDQAPGSGATLLSVTHNSDTELWLSEGQRTRHISTVSGKINAEMSVSRIEQAISRWITWTDDTGEIWAMRTQDEPFKLRLPWPTVNKCGRAATDASSRLILPLCIQSPRGEFDQLIAAVIDGPGPPQIRHVSRFRPTTHLTNVNAGGHVDWILVRPGALDQVQILHTDEHTRPPAVSPLWRTEDGQQIQSASWTMTDTPAVRTVLDTEAELIHPLVGSR